MQLSPSTVGVDPWVDITGGHVSLIFKVGLLDGTSQRYNKETFT